MLKETSPLNTLKLGEVRRAGSGDGFAPAILIVDQIAAAIQGRGETTFVLMAGGVELEVALPLDRFLNRLVIDDAKT